MTPLSDALTAAQRRALAALEKAYVAGAFEDEGEAGLMEQLERIGLTDPIDAAYLRECLDVLRVWGAPVPAENGTKPDPAAEKISPRQRGFIEQLCREKNLAEPDDIELLTKAQAHECINDLQAGNYDPKKWAVPF